VEIREGANLIAAGTVDGDYVYGYRMTIVEPIYEGRLYTYKVTVWDANTKVLLGSASASYVEKYCPDMQISDVSWDRFVYGRSATVRMAVRNLGERGWTYTVEAWTEGGPAGVCLCVGACWSQRDCHSQPACYQLQVVQRHAGGEGALRGGPEVCGQEVFRICDSSETGALRVFYVSGGGEAGGGGSSSWWV
jgi:uncharacterized membrane protein YgcG